MRVVSCIYLLLSAFSSWAEDSGTGPKVYVDISKSAQEDAISFDGVRGILGLNLLSSGFDASIGNSENFTENRMNLLGLCLGMEYARAFRKGFLLAVDVTVDISKKSKKEGNWEILNKEYEAQRGRFHLGNRTGKFEKDLLSFQVALRGGYLIPSYKSMIFMKLGIGKMGGNYLYKVDNVDVCDIHVNAYVPSLGLGVERKINRKWGVSLEANWFMKKTVTGIYDNCNHRTKIGNRNIRLMGIYSIQDK